MKNCKKLRHCVRVYSLPTDVLWGSFITHSFLPPWGKNECVTNEPQRTSAGRLERVYITVWLYSKRLCLSWATIIINYMYSHIYLCLWIDKQPVRECTVQILNFLKAFFWSSLTHISRLRCLHLLALQASLTPSVLTQSTCGKSIQIGICKQYCFPLPPPILFVCFSVQKVLQSKPV